MTSAIAAGGNLDVIVNALRERQEARAALRADADRIAGTGVDPIDRADVERKIRTRLTEWRELFGSNPSWTRQVIGQLLSDKITLTPHVDRKGAPIFRVKLPFTLGPLFAKICPKGVASPMPASWNQIAGWLRQIDSLRRAA